jgi:photosystem II stability/assembly factor-like uncharacterized protein
MRRPTAPSMVLTAVALTAFVATMSGQTRVAPGSSGEDSTRFGGLAWRNVGPWRGGRATTIAGVVGKPMIYYMGATGGGVWKTEDAGISWRPISDGQLKMGSIGAIAVAPDDDNVIYVGTGEAPVRGVSSSYGDGMYKSTDAGRTWSRIGLTESRTISRVIVHPRNNDIVYVAAQGSRWGRSAERGVYRSADGGRTWKLLLASPDSLAGPSDLAMDPSNPRILYAAMWSTQRTPWKVRSGGPASGIWKTVDGGETWNRLETGLPKLMGKIGLAVSRTNPDRVWAIVEADEGGLFRSDDQGKTWTRVNGDRILQARSWYYMRVTADPRNPDVVYVINSPLLKSIDAGKSFSTLPDPHGDNHDLWINPDNTTNLAKADDGGAAVSFTGGTTWSPITNQATAQFYRVTVDERFPYWLYSGQQDNSTVAIPSATDGGGIPNEAMMIVGGGESAHIALDPAAPRYIYGTGYHGQLDEYDLSNRFIRDVRPYPTVGLAEPSDRMKYRFNWSTPVITSPHDRQTLYYGGNVLFRSADRGQSWTVVSPDLTRNDKSRQGLGGEPITNEGAGGEVYGTIYYITESPLEKGVLWVGTDDGLVQLSRDGGTTWNNVTPRDLPESLINMVEVSPHDRATAYIAVDRHKWNDNTPMVYKTTDYGKSWVKIVTGLREGEPVRVVREDRTRRDLLYAGTETGVYLSFDGGAHWQPFQRNLPAVPVTDIKVTKKDLVIATEGRAFWIMDDVSPLYEMSDSMARAPLHLVTPRAAYRTSLGGGPEQLGQGTNPPLGAILQYHLAKAPDSAAALTLEILDSHDAVIRRFSSTTPKDAAPGALRSPKLPAAAGLNRFVWDLRREPVAGVPGTLSGQNAGYRVVPGAYKVRLTLAGQVRMQPLDVLPDPRETTSAEAFRGQQEMLEKVYGRIDEVHGAARRLRATREQVQGVIARTRDQTAADTIAKAGGGLIAKIDSLEGLLVNVRNKTFQDVVNYPPGINAEFQALIQTIDGTDAPVTGGVRARFADLETEWAGLRVRVDAVFGAQLERFNALMREKGVPAVTPGPIPTNLIP